MNKLEFRKNGFNDSDAATLAKTATMFQNVSDEAISAGDSASFIISQMIAFGIEAKDAQSIIDKVNETANKFSVSSGDLSKALGIVASTSSAMGNSIDQTLGVVTAITEQTRNASKSARAANTIFSRLAQVVDENSDTGAKLTEIYNNLGIALYDSSGQMRSTYDILADLASKWDSLDKNTQQYIAITSAGTNQLNNFLALMNNFDHAAEATATSMNSAGSAMRENEAYQESLEYQTNNLKATFQDLANNVIDKELISSVLKLSNAFLELANTGLGQFITKTALLGGTAWGLSSLVKVTKIIPVITSQFKNLASVMGMISNPAVVSSIGGIGTALSTVGGFAGVALPVLLAVGAAIVGIYEGVKAYNEYVESHKFENLVKHFKELDEQAKEAADNLEDVKKRLDELNNTPVKDRGQDWQNEIDKLETLKQYYEYIEQMRQGQAAEAQAEAYSASVEVGSTVTRKSVEVRGRTAQVRLEDIGKYANESDAVYELAAKENIQLTEKQAEALSKLTDETEIAAQGYQYLKENLESLGYIFSNTTQTAEEYTAAQSRNMSVLSSEISMAVSNGEEITQLQQDEYEGYIKSNQGRYEYIKGLDDVSDQQKAFAANYETMVRNFVKYNLSNGLMDTTDAVTYLTNVLSDGAQAALEFAQSYGLIGKDVTFDSLGLVELADGALALKENCYQATDGLYYLKDGCEALAGSGDGAADALSQIEVATYDTSTAAAQLTASLFDQNGQLTTAAQTALSVDGSMVSLAQSELQAQQAAAQANYANLILEIEKVGSAAMITAGQLQNMIALAGVQGTMASMSGAEQVKYNKMLYYQSTGKKADQDIEAYNKWTTDMLQKNAGATYDRIMSETQKKLDELEKNFPSGVGGGSSKKSAEEKAAEEAEKQAKKAQQAQEKAAKESQEAYESAAKSAEQVAQEAARAAEQAAEEAKQKILDSIQELKDASDDFWESKTDAIEETNKELDRQKQLEEKLKALEEAKQKKILLYKNGQFQYDKDYGTIAKAQADYEETRDKIQRERELEQLEEMKDNATEIFNEMKDIVQNGGNVTQEMINNWLKNMAASGADYYDSNKKLLNEWLDWAKNAIKEFGQATVEAAGGTYTSTSSLMSSGSYSGSSATATDTNGAGYLNDPMYWDKNGNFVGFSTAWWIDRFDKQMKSGFKPEEWLGGGLGTNLFDDWEEVFKYWAENTTDPYALQDMADRLKAAQIVMSNYKDLFKSLGYDEYYQLAEKAEAIDPTNISKMGWGAGAIAHPDDPFGWRSITASDIKGSATGELYSLLRDISDYEWIRSDTDIVSDISAAFKAYRTSKQGAATGYSGEVEFDTTNLKAFFDDNNKRLEELGQLWFDASEEQRKLLEQEAEARRKAGELAAGQLGIEGASEIYEAQREANRQAGGTMEARQQQKKNAKNIESIEEILQAVEKGQDISDEYINSAKDYLAKAIKENREASDKLYSDTEKAKLDAQNEQMKDISDRLNNIQESGVSIKTTDLLEGETTPWEDQFDKEDIQDWLRDEDFDKDLETKRAQMLENAEAWWNATTQEERDALHKANEALAKEIGGLTYDSSSGVWSKHATGTHNARGGLSIVGERGPEMRILNKGDNIIPANQTANLWKWSNTTPQAVLSTLSSRNGSGNTSYAFDVSRIELPNVTDAKSFVQGLKNYALQYSYKR